MRQEGEPSVEEILESIKKVIARDNRENAAAERRRRESAGMRIDEADEDEDDGGILELSDAAEVIEDGAPEPAATPVLSEEAERTMRQSLAELTLLAEADRDSRACATGTSVEAMVREMLKPMLAQWLDRNMPAIVERVVKAEIARLRG